MRVLVACVVCASLGCGGASTTAPTTDFAPEDDLLFDNSIDFVDRPAIVESEWRGQFERRVTRANIIAVVMIQSLSSVQDRQGAGYRLTAKVTELLKGASDREIVLRTHDGEPGFRRVQVNENRLLRDPFVAFIRWENDPEFEELVPRWHLSPDSPGVRDKVTFFLSPPPGDDRTQVEVLAP